MLVMAEYPILARSAITTLFVVPSLMYRYCLPGMLIALDSAARSLSLSSRIWPRPMSTARSTPPDPLAVLNSLSSASVYSPVREVLARLLPAAFCFDRKPSSLEARSALE